MFLPLRRSRSELPQKRLYLFFSCGAALPSVAATSPPRTPPRKRIRCKRSLTGCRRCFLSMLAAEIAPATGLIMVFVSQSLKAASLPRRIADALFPPRYRKPSAGWEGSRSFSRFQLRTKPCFALSAALHCATPFYFPAHSPEGAKKPPSGKQKPRQPLAPDGGGAKSRNETRLSFCTPGAQLASLRAFLSALLYVTALNPLFLTC